jgi:hypothetical protein
MTKRLGILLGVFVLLGALALWLEFGQARSQNQEPQRVLADWDTSSLLRLRYVFQQDTIEVGFDKRGWVLNNQYPAREDWIELLNKALPRLEVKRSLEPAATEKAKAHILKAGSAVQLSDGQQKIQFVLAPHPDDPNASYLMQPNGTILVVHVPGFKGEISTVFRMKVLDWREPALFVSKPGQEISISVQYPSKPEDGFQLSYSQGRVVFQPEVEQDTNKVYSYLDLYRYLSVDGYFNAAGQDSLVRLYNGRDAFAHLSLKWAPTQDWSKISFFIPNSAQDPLVIGRLENGEWVALRKEKVFRLLVKKSFFKAGGKP